MTGKPSYAAGGRGNTAHNGRKTLDSLWRILVAFALCFTVAVAPSCSPGASGSPLNAGASNAASNAAASQFQQQDGAGQPAIPYNGEDAVPYDGEASGGASGAASSALSAQGDDGAAAANGGDPAQSNAPPAGNAAGNSAQGANAGAANPNAPATPSAQPAGNLTVRFLDVGQGDCALLTCNGESMLIDGGPSKASDKVYSVLRDLGISRLKAIVATHGDADHIGGLAAALTGASADTFYCSTFSHNTKTFQKLKEKLGAQPIVRPNRGDSFTLGAATVQFLGPSVYGDDSNNNSLVCKVTLGSRSFLFTGDAESESESQLLRSGQNLSADVLKVGHHGSRSSSTSAFLRAVAPAYAVISVGKNSYGHPTAEVLNRLGSTGAGAQTLRTDQLGTIYFQTDGATLTQSASTGKVTW